MCTLHDCVVPLANVRNNYIVRQAAYVVPLLKWSVYLYSYIIYLYLVHAHTHSCWRASSVYELLRTVCSQESY